MSTKYVSEKKDYLVFTEQKIVNELENKINYFKINNMTNLYISNL